MYKMCKCWSKNLLSDNSPLNQKPEINLFQNKPIKYFEIWIQRKTIVNLLKKSKKSVRAHQKL